MHAAAHGVTREQFITSIREMTLLKRLPSLADLGKVAVLMASDYAGTMTGTVATNMSCGQIVDWVPTGKGRRSEKGEMKRWQLQPEMSWPEPFVRGSRS